MELHLTPELEAHLAQIANHRGQTAEQLVVSAVLNATASDRRLLEGTERGLAQAERGLFVDETEMNRRLQRSAVESNRQHMKVLEQRIEQADRGEFLEEEDMDARFRTLIIP